MEKKGSFKNCCLKGSMGNLSMALMLNHPFGTFIFSIFSSIMPLATDALVLIVN